MLSSETSTNWHCCSWNKSDSLGNLVPDWRSARFSIVIESRATSSLIATAVWQIFHRQVYQIDQILPHCKRLVYDLLLHVLMREKDRLSHLLANQRTHRLLLPRSEVLRLAVLVLLLHRYELRCSIVVLL